MMRTEAPSCNTERKLGVRGKLRLGLRKISALAVVILLSFPAAVLAQSPETLLPGHKPPDIPDSWKPWIGEYTHANPSMVGVVYVLSEKDGFIWISERNGDSRDAQYTFRARFSSHSPPPKAMEGVQGFVLGIDFPGGPMLVVSNVSNGKRPLDTGTSQSGHIKLVRPIDELRVEALAATPPQETGNFRKTDLVELAPLDPGIHLDIRYATSNDFLGTPVYSQARAYLQRPAAEALLRVQQKLKPLGYGLLIHDAYRPWYVTKIFWDATPPEGKIFVADPAQGSRHNRGCAVDLTLYDLASGKPIEMPGTYDEMSPRSFPDYPGGTSLQRWHRDLLRRAMESEGFTVYEAEWWHFDYKDWKEYPILNVPFEKLGLDAGAGTAH
jgi:zinc D-Ala-D-Ala dipeptidase